MTAAYDESLLLAYIEGDASEAEASQVQALVDQDPRLGRLLSQMKTDRMALLSLPVETAPAGLVDDILAGQERQALLGEPITAQPTAPQSERVYRFTRVAGYLAAAAAMGLCATVLFGVLKTPSDFDGAGSGLVELAQNSNEADDKSTAINSDTNPTNSIELASDLTPSPTHDDTDGATPGNAHPGIASGNAIETFAASTKPNAIGKPGLQHAAQPRQLELVAVCASPEAAHIALQAWAGEQDLLLSKAQVDPDGSQTFVVAWRSTADVSDLKSRLRKQGLARLAHEGTAPAVAETQTISYIEGSPAARSLEQLTGAALAARVVGVAVAHAHDEPIMIDNPRSLMRLLDHAAGGYASGAELGAALGSSSNQNRQSRWIADTPIIDQAIGPVIRVTIKPAPAAVDKNLDETLQTPAEDPAILKTLPRF